MTAQISDAHYCDVIMGAMASEITSLTIVYSNVHSSRSEKTSKLRVTDLCEGNSPMTSEFPTQRASNAENVSILWRDHDYRDHSQIVFPTDLKQCMWDNVLNIMETLETFQRLDLDVYRLNCLTAVCTAYNLMHQSAVLLHLKGYHVYLNSQGNCCSVQVLRFAWII